MSRLGKRASSPALAAIGLLLAGCAAPSGDWADKGGEPELYSALSDADVAMAASTLQAGLETRPNGATADWHNPASGNAGSITPSTTLISEDGSFCRRYAERLALADGRTTTLEHTACRDSAGRWIWLEG